MDRLERTLANPALKGAAVDALPMLGFMGGLCLALGLAVAGAPLPGLGIVAVGGASSLGGYLLREALTAPRPPAPPPGPEPPPAREVEAELAEATRQIADMQRELMELKRGADLGGSERARTEASDALVLAASARKLLGEIQARVQRHDYATARHLLRDEDARLPFDLRDPARAILEREESARPWTDQLHPGNWVYQKSLREVMQAVAERRDRVREEDSSVTRRSPIIKR